MGILLNSAHLLGPLASPNLNQKCTMEVHTQNTKTVFICSFGCFIFSPVLINCCICLFNSSPSQHQHISTAIQKSEHGKPCPIFFFRILRNNALSANGDRNEMVQWLFSRRRDDGNKEKLYANPADLYSMATTTTTNDHNFVHFVGRRATKILRSQVLPKTNRYLCWT